MALKLEIIHAQDLIRTTPEGELDWAKTKEIFDATVMAAQELTDFVILIDLRKVQGSTLTTVQIWELAEFLINYGTVFARRTALLLPEEAPGHGARFFELCGA